MNKTARDKEAVKAVRIVEEDTIKFMRWYESLALTPTIAAIRKKTDDICRQELEKTLSRLDGLSENDRKALEKMIGSISSKMLHDPLSYLKQQACGHRDDTDKRLDTIRNVFGLKGE